MKVECLNCGWVGRVELKDVCFNCGSADIIEYEPDNDCRTEHDDKGDN